MQAWVHSRKQFILYSEDGRIPAEKKSTTQEVKWILSWEILVLFVKLLSALFYNLVILLT